MYFTACAVETKGKYHVSIPSRVVTKVDQLTVISKVEGDAHTPNDAELYWASHKDDLRRCVYDSTLATLTKFVGLLVAHNFPVATNLCASRFPQGIFGLWARNKQKMRVCLRGSGMGARHTLLGGHF